MLDATRHRDNVASGYAPSAPRTHLAPSAAPAPCTRADSGLAPALRAGATAPARLCNIENDTLVILPCPLRGVRSAARPGMGHWRVRGDAGRGASQWRRQMRVCWNVCRAHCGA